MGIGIDDVVGGATTGGLYNVAKATGLLGGSKTTSQVPLETPEQRAARQALLQFAQTGKFGDFQAGAEVPLATATSPPRRPSRPASPSSRTCSRTGSRTSTAWATRR
jgi:hypothetical protein